MTDSPRTQLDRFLAEFSPDIARAARRAHSEMRKLLPRGTVEMVYDNFNALVIGFGATDRASEAVLSLAIFPKWVTLCFIWGKRLPDPKKRLKGGGNQVRHVRLVDGPRTLSDPDIRALIGEAVKRSTTKFAGTGRSTMIIKSVSAKRRPRRPA